MDESEEKKKAASKPPQSKASGVGEAGQHGSIMLPWPVYFDKSARIPFQGAHLV
jgi:hypothetical protein